MFVSPLQPMAQPRFSALNIVIPDLPGGRFSESSGLSYLNREGKISPFCIEQTSSAIDRARNLPRGFITVNDANLGQSKEIAGVSVDLQNGLVDRALERLQGFLNKLFNTNHPDEVMDTSVADGDRIFGPPDAQQAPRELLEANRSALKEYLQLGRFDPVDVGQGRILEFVKTVPDSFLDEHHDNEDALAQPVTQV